MVQKILSPKKFWVKKNMGQKNLGPNENFGYKNNFWVQKSLSPKNYQTKKNLVPNNFRSKIFGTKTIWSQTKLLDPKIILSQKRFLSKEKILVGKKWKSWNIKEFWLQGKFLSKNFVKKNCHQDKWCKDKCHFDNYNLSEMIP